MVNKPYHFIAFVSSVFLCICNFLNLEAISSTTTNNSSISMMNLHRRARPVSSCLFLAWRQFWSYCNCLKLLKQNKEVNHSMIICQLWKEKKKRISGLVCFYPPSYIFDHLSIKKSRRGMSNALIDSIVYLNMLET